MKLIAIWTTNDQWAQLTAGDGIGAKSMKIIVAAAIKKETMRTLFHLQWII